MTTNTGTAGSHRAIVYAWVPKRSFRPASWYLSYLEWLCERTGHMHACRLLNARGPFRVWGRFLSALTNAASTQRAVRL